MADVTTKKYVTLDNLSYYDGKIKTVVTSGDATVLQSAKDYADGKDGAIAAAKKAGDDAAAAASVADGKAVAAQSAADTAQAEVDALEVLVGTLPEGATASTVVGFVEEKTANIASSDTVSALSEKMTQAEADIDAIEADYLKGADKTELAGDIAEVATAVETEKARAEGVEGGLDTRIKAVEDDYLKAADKTELEGKITTVSNAVEVLTEGVDAEKVDGVKDLIKYVEDHGTEVTGMKEDIEANATAIAALEAVDNATQAEMEAAITTVNASIALKADKTTVEGIEGRVADLEAIDVATKSDVNTAKTEAVSEAKTYSDGLNTAMTTKVDGVIARVGAVETGKADKATTLAGYGITDAYTSEQTDEAIEGAIDEMMATFEAITDGEINALFA